MPPPPTHTVLITGATRGLGRGFTAHYLLRPSTTVIACIRAPTSPAALSLHTLPLGPSSRLLLLPMDAASEPSVAAALATLPAHGIDALTLVIANAAAAGPVGRLGDVEAGELAAAVVGTGLGPLWVWRGSVGMLRRGGGGGKFVAVGSDMGSVGLVGQTGAVPLGAYGAGKAVVNYVVARVAVEETGVVSFVVHPGSVDTEGARKLIDELGLDVKPMSVEESVAAVTKVIENATQETSGRFLSYTGEEMPW